MVNLQLQLRQVSIPDPWPIGDIVWSSIGSPYCPCRHSFASMRYSASVKNSVGRLFPNRVLTIIRTISFGLSVDRAISKGGQWTYRAWRCQCDYAKHLTPHRHRNLLLCKSSTWGTTSTAGVPRAYHAARWHLCHLPLLQFLQSAALAFSTVNVTAVFAFHRLWHGRAVPLSLAPFTCPSRTVPRVVATDSRVFVPGISNQPRPSSSSSWALAPLITMVPAPVAQTGVIMRRPFPQTPRSGKQKSAQGLETKRHRTKTPVPCLPGLELVSVPTGLVDVRSTRLIAVFARASASGVPGPVTDARRTSAAMARHCLVCWRRSTRRSPATRLGQKSPLRQTVPCGLSR